MNDGESRTAIVTGGSSGMRRAIAESLARNGDRVVIIGRSKERLVETAEDIGPAVSWRQADVGRRRGVWGHGRAGKRRRIRQGLHD